MNIQLENWGIVKMNYFLLKEKEKREDNSLGLKFKNFFNDKYKKSFKIAFALLTLYLLYDIIIVC